MNINSTSVRHPLAVEVGKRYFSLEQANRSLVLVSRITADILSDYQKVLDQQEILEVHQRRHQDSEATSTQAVIYDLVERLQSYADELLAIGGEMRDWATGAIDFPCLENGREISLCWQHGESTVCHWHYNDEACSSRRGISTLQPESLAKS